MPPASPVARGGASPEHADADDRKRRVGLGGSRHLATLDRRHLDRRGAHPCPGGADLGGAPPAHGARGARAGPRSASRARSTTRRAQTATRAEPAAVTGSAGPVRVYRQTSRGVTRVRARRAPRSPAAHPVACRAAHRRRRLRHRDRDDHRHRPREHRFGQYDTPWAQQWRLGRRTRRSAAAAGARAKEQQPTSTEQTPTTTQPEQQQTAAVRHRACHTSDRHRAGGPAAEHDSLDRRGRRPPRLSLTPSGAMHDHAHAHTHVHTDDARRLTGALALILGLMAVEVVAGILASSLALLSDAAHMLTDAGAIALALFAARLAQRPARRRLHVRLPARRDPVGAAERRHARRARGGDRRGGDPPPDRPARHPTAASCSWSRWPASR